MCDYSGGNGMSMLPTRTLKNLRLSVLHWVSWSSTGEGPFLKRRVNIAFEHTHIPVTHDEHLFFLCRLQEVVQCSRATRAGREASEH